MLSFRENREEPAQEIAAPTIVINFSSSLLLKDRVAVHSAGMWLMRLTTKTSRGGGQIPSGGPGGAELARALLE